ncbi:MAG: asparagine synthetase B, partial [Deltaproteobacteria bacterium]|nr:asparagine synthetase B [Deltaproteobacteria bacterium]
MCGIAGIVGPNARGLKAPLQAMTDRIAHRGPDGEGRLFFDGAALGHRRLSIVDLEGGAQPLTSRDEKLAVVFNGELYGYRELLGSLAGQYPFKTRCDTELLLALYRAGDPAAWISRLRGMFAFALWDENTRTLTCARDPFGEKPFYYAYGPSGELVFASEVKALLASGLITPKVRSESLAFYLRRLYVHPTKTIFENVHCLPPAHYLVFKDGKTTVGRSGRRPPSTTRSARRTRAASFAGFSRTP